MLFQVVRTSLWDDEKPFKNCIPIKLTYVEVRTLRTPEEFDERFGDREGKWLENGANHRINEQGFLTRDRGLKDKWGIEINSLEELMDFSREVGADLVIRTSSIDKKTPCIEIYDDYRE